MPVTGLDDYLTRLRDLERSKDFYVGVLGIEIMPRPEWGRGGLLADAARENDPGMRAM